MLLFITIYYCLYHYILYIAALSAAPNVELPSARRSHTTSLPPSLPPPPSLLPPQFWLYLITWHVGLFVTLTLGQIGIQGGKQGLFPRQK